MFCAMILRTITQRSGADTIPDMQKKYSLINGICVPTEHREEVE